MNNNPFNDTKDYWGAYYSNIAESATKDILHDMGYYFTNEGEHAGKWVHETTGKALSPNHAMEIAAERSQRKKKANNSEPDAAGPNPTDKDARKQGEESTHYEEVDHEGEQLDEGGRFTTKTKQEESLFHKDSDRLLREHIREEYQSRGIYPTSREVQETFNHVVDLLEKTTLLNELGDTAAGRDALRRYLGARSKQLPSNASDKDASDKKRTRRIRRIETGIARAHHEITFKGVDPKYVSFMRGL